MAANYWNSTQAKFWTYDKTQLAKIRDDLAQANSAVYKKYALPDYRHMCIYMRDQLQKLAKPMSLRQQALATAQIYIKRFYLRVEIRRTNPYLIMATAVYLACKMEECPQHIRLMLCEAARRWPELGVSETNKIGECEFALISTLDSRLILHHPYRALGELQGQLGLSSEEVNLAQLIINDSYNTDLALLYAPHVIAVTAVFLAAVLRPAQSPGIQAAGGASTSVSPAMTGSTAQSMMANGLRPGAAKLSKLIDWLAESQIDMRAVVDATQEMVSLYECWDSYSEKACKEAISRFMKETAVK